MSGAPSGWKWLKGDTRSPTSSDVFNAVAESQVLGWRYKRSLRQLEKNHQLLQESMAEWSKLNSKEQEFRRRGEVDKVEAMKEEWAEHGKKYDRVLGHAHSDFGSKVSGKVRAGLFAVGEALLAPLLTSFYMLVSILGRLLGVILIAACMVYALVKLFLVI